MAQRFGWGHIDINVSNLDVTIGFYRKLGFEPFIPDLPYLNLVAEARQELPAEATEALGLDGHLDRWPPIPDT